MTPQASDEVASVFSRWFAAMEAADIDLALSLVTEDVIHVSPSGDRRVGRAQLREALLAFHTQFTETIRWTIEDLDISGQEAQVRIREVATIQPRDGSPVFQVAGFHAARLIQTHEREWLISHDVGYLEGER